MKSFVCPSLALFTVSANSRSPGIKRSCPILRRGPLGISLIPVASITRPPGRPLAKRSYQSRTLSVTKPSSVARHGTIAGTQVRCSNVIQPISIGLNNNELDASLAVGQEPGLGSNFMRCIGFHI